MTWLKSVTHTAMEKAAPSIDLEFAEKLREQFGTPLYILFEEVVAAKSSSWEAINQPVHLSYATKANPTLEVLRWFADRGWSLDVASEGELRAALTAGVSAADCRFHGNAKLQSELEFALGAGIGEIIADNMEELEMIASCVGGQTAMPRLALRVAPGVNPETNAKISTGGAASKFGFSWPEGEVIPAWELATELGLQPSGLHAHIGSQIIDLQASKESAETLGQIAAEVESRFPHALKSVNFGGGLGVANGVPSPKEYMLASLETFPRKDLEFGFEPGRSMVADAGKTLYSVAAIKRRQGKLLVSVDGGLSDNPRPALYGAKYDVEPLRKSAQTESADIFGRHCETDLLFEDIQVPTDLEIGDLLLVHGTGAYNATMASNYNRFPRPAQVFLRSSGEVQLIQRRETYQDMFAREILPR
ncbi:MAG: diaminopimelate decarboxylase [Armatimonadetes bacterium]|nr:diaminopimelate decarboxylase [Armatimonadota bacterium]